MKELDVEAMMKNIVLQFTPENLEAASKKAYQDDREYPENFSNWYYSIKDFGNFKHANIIVNQIFTWEETEKMQETDIISKVKWNELKKILKPTLSKLKPNTLYNIKNGCFSNKFDFQTCIATKENLVEQLWKINYQSCMFSTGGYTELVVREVIPYDYQETATIYNGMPLREELRVFYNMDTKQIEYIVDYWDYEYCRPNLSNKNDQLIFDWFHDKLKLENENSSNKTKIDTHNHILESLKRQIQKDISTLKFDDKLTGIWSIDFMSVRNLNKCGWDLYLIDMARGFRSAYWNPDKISKGVFNG